MLKNSFWENLFDRFKTKKLHYYFGRKHFFFTKFSKAKLLYKFFSENMKKQPNNSVTFLIIQKIRLDR